MEWLLTLSYPDTWFLLNMDNTQDFYRLCVSKEKNPLILSKKYNMFY